jgi:hypothetical protein
MYIIPFLAPQAYSKERDYLKNLSIEGRIKIKYILNTWDEREWTGLIWFRLVPSENFVLLTVHLETYV